MQPTALHYSAGQRLVREAKKWLGTVELPGNRGVFVDFANLLAIGDWRWAKGAPWCASFVYLMGRLALGDEWIVPRTASVQALADWGASMSDERPLHVGALVLVWFDSKQRYGHVGIVTGVEGEKVSTIEGNTNRDGGREGFGVLARKRRIDPAKLRFLNWE
jgi:cell wall-associated NlpC family hydrolase